MTGTEIITSFELYVDDTTELSSAEELALVNKKYQWINQLLPWEYKKNAATGTVLNTGSTYYITLPSGFESLVENNNYTENFVQNQSGMAPKVIFIGSTYIPYLVINISDRRQYLNQRGFCYLDIVNSQIVFTYQPESLTYEFDYLKTPDNLTTATSPIFPTRFHEAIYHLMATDDLMIQMFDKAKSYAPENAMKAKEYIDSMKFWNSSLISI